MTENPWIPLLELTGTFQTGDLGEFDAGQLLARAAKAKKDGEKEITYGGTINEILMSDGESPESQRSLATIGVWHFECAVELFEKAIRNFQRAKERGLNQDEQKKVETRIKQCQKRLDGVAQLKKSAEDLLSSINN